MKQQTLVRDDSSGAEIVGPYRYRLWRAWDDRPRVLWIMLNPSRADAEKNDPSIRRVVDFSRRWGFGGCEVANMFAWRATDPKVLLKEKAAGRDIVGDLNDTNIEALAHTSSLIVAAWGAKACEIGRRELDVRVLLLRLGHRVSCLGKTKTGAPRHPLYVKATQPLEDFP